MAHGNRIFRPVDPPNSSGKFYGLSGTFFSAGFDLAKLLCR